MLALAAVGGLLLKDDVGPSVGEQGTAPSTLTAMAVALDDRTTIAVLPLRSLSANEENSYLAAGVHEELLRRLSLVRGLAVISRTSVLGYADAPKPVPEIARELGADWVVEGSVQGDGERVRIQIQLIDGATDRHVWAEVFDRTVEDIFELQSEVAQAIARELVVTIDPEERDRIEARPTEDLVAYDLYLRAMDLSMFVRDEYDAAVGLLRRATDRDPGFALAHARLAHLYNDGRIIHGAAPVGDNASDRADLAVELAPDLPEALSIKGRFSSGLEARAWFERALALDPSSSLAWSGLARWGWQSGDNVGGAVAARRGLQVGPNDANTALHLAYCLAFVEINDEAAVWFERVLEMRPGDLYALFSMTWFSTVNRDYPSAHRWASRALEASADNALVLWSVAQLEIAEGNLEAAANALGEIVRSQPNLSLGRGGATAQVLLGWVLAESGRSEGQEQLERLQELRLEAVAAGRASEPTYRDLSVIASVLGTPDEQLRWFLEASPVERGGGLYRERDFPWLDPIRNMAEFQAWLETEAEELAAQRRELEALGPWTLEAVLGSR